MFSLFLNIAIGLMKSQDQLSSKTLMLTCLQISILVRLLSESTQIKLFDVAKAHVCEFKRARTCLFYPTTYSFYIVKCNSKSGVLFRKDQTNKLK